MKKRTKRRLTRLVALVLTLISLASPLMVVFATNDSVAPRAEGISDTGIYMLRNKLTGLYLTIPQYTDSSKNVYQSVRNTQNPYALAVKLTYSQTTGLYTISSVLYENLISGRVTFDQTTSNVYLTQEYNIGTEQWHISYNDLYGGYIIRTADGSKVLTAIGSVTGSSTDADPNSYGNIALTNYIGASSQVWEIASVSPNAHIVKPYSPSSTSGIEKKNIAKNSEWLFQIRNSEMTNRTIISVEAVTAQSLVQIAYTNHYFVVKINENDATAQDITDNFALIKITLDGNEIRYIIVQDAGTGNGDACWTMPVYQYPRMQTITITDPHQYMITLSSELNGVKINQWDVSDTSVANITSVANNPLMGNNYVVITALATGIVKVTATASSSDGEITYTKLIEVQKKQGGNIEAPENVIDMSMQTTATTPIELCIGEKYILKSNSLLRKGLIDSNGIPLGDNPNAYWNVWNETKINIIEAGDNYVEFQVFGESYDYINRVTDVQNYVNGISAFMLSGNHDVYFSINRDFKLFLPNGRYYLQNSQYYDRFMQTNSTSVNDFIEIYSIDEELDQQWDFIYLNNGFYRIKSAENEYSLMINEDVLYDEDARIRQGVYDPNSYRYQWAIIRSTEGGYIIKNRATLENLETSSFSVATGPALIEGRPFNNVLNRTIQSDHSDKWHILSVNLSEEYVNETFGKFNPSEPIYPHIGFWENDPTFDIVFVDTEILDSAISRTEMLQCIEFAVDLWSEALGINITRVSNGDAPNIIIRITDEEEFYDKYEIHNDYRSPNADGMTEYVLEKHIYSKYYDGNEVEIYKYNHVACGIFTHRPKKTFQGVVIHELGHALGYGGHAVDESEIMYREVDSDNNTDYDIRPEDIDCLRTVYKESYRG